MYSQKPVLLIEDDKIDQMTVQRAFDQLHIKNKLAIRENGEDGLKYLKEMGKPCLIILDLNMPRMNGMEFLDAVKKDKIYRNIPIIVFTTSYQDREKMKAFDKCIVGYIVKPMDNSKFIDIFAGINTYWSISEGPIT
ncbi:response regulator [Legionella spiritensis]|uniref:Two-component response regulator n=1 Tax=Legionella spiritensis TaxID=452 RepID=A0A0W0Z874_LEGSP|nr:response regulator [Legionella spiritensis]KTD65281.1 two-component response regulator [Legionella spiritensis]SNV30117.1 two-component response regulator [Legionella spiritensis]VEG91863.1 two-component response regulator [Legionella spiritensis]